MLPFFGPITPYRRVCGAIFLVVAVVLAPHLHFAISLAVSSAVAWLSILASLTLYLVIIALPPMRRVGHAASVAALVVALVSAALGNVFGNPLKQITAAAIGFYDEQVPWLAAQPVPGSRTYRNPFGGYTLQIPQTWEHSDGPLTGPTELTLRRGEDAALAARLRPSCDASDAPLAMAVVDMLSKSQDVVRSCGHSHGMEACLLAQGAVASPTEPMRWEWLARGPDSKAQIRLTSELYDEAARSDAMSIIASAQGAPASYNASACPNPSQWAEPFSP